MYIDNDHAIMPNDYSLELRAQISKGTITPDEYYHNFLNDLDRRNMNKPEVKSVATDEDLKRDKETLVEVIRAGTVIEYSIDSSLHEGMVMHISIAMDTDTSYIAGQHPFTEPVVIKKKIKRRIL